MNECARCHRTFDSDGPEFEHGCEVDTRDHGRVWVCAHCMFPGEAGQWAHRKLIEQIAERTARRILDKEKAATA